MRRFDVELNELSKEMILMGSMCNEAIRNCINATIHHDLNLVEKTRDCEIALDKKEKDIESLCMKLLIQQHPVARDLRRISSALKMITDMERIGDQARDIAEISQYVDLSEFSTYENFTEMTKEVIKMVTNAIDSFITGDVQLAKKVIENDDVVDGLFNTIKNDVVQMVKQRDRDEEKCLDLVMIIKYLERIGDHATNLAEWVDFVVTGVHEEKE